MKPNLTKWRAKHWRFRKLKLHTLLHQQRWDHSWGASGVLVKHFTFSVRSQTWNWLRQNSMGIYSMGGWSCETNGSCTGQTLRRWPHRCRSTPGSCCNPSTWWKSTRRGWERGLPQRRTNNFNHLGCHRITSPSDWHQSLHRRNVWQSWISIRCFGHPRQPRSRNGCLHIRTHLASQTHGCRSRRIKSRNKILLCQRKLQETCMFSTSVIYIFIKYFSVLQSPLCSYNSLLLHFRHLPLLCSLQSRSETWNILGCNDHKLALHGSRNHSFSLCQKGNLCNCSILS